MPVETKIYYRFILLDGHLDKKKSVCKNQFLPDICLHLVKYDSIQNIFFKFYIPKGPAKPFI